MTEKLIVPSITVIRDLIYTVRSKQVMLDKDLAELYGVETKVLNQAVKRNSARFPQSFMFQLTTKEYGFLRSQIVTIEKSGDGGRGKHRKYLPNVFTEQGVAMLSAVLRSKTAIDISVQIMNAFVQMRRLLISSGSIVKRLGNVEQKLLEHDTQFSRVFKALEEKNDIPEKGVFFDGQIYDAYILASKIIPSAKKSLVLIDNYIDESVLTLFTKRRKNVSAKIYTKTISRQLKLDIEKHNQLSDEDLWLTQNQIAEIYDTTQQNINLHIKNIYSDNELSRDSTYKEFLLVQTEGRRQVKRSIGHFNLDMIIAIGYRVQSQIATRFRRWATQRLHEYIQKGFAMDDERLKQGGNRYFRELLQRIRDIRSSERNFYQQVTDIYATSIDYDPRSDMTKQFFAAVQNKLHFAVHKHTAAEIIHKRVDSDKPYIGMTNFKGDYITKDDVRIAKNYLSEKELTRLNLLVSGFLDFAEFKAVEQEAMSMKDWIEALDNQIMALKRAILEGKGAISHQQAIEKAEK